MALSNPREDIWREDTGYVSIYDLLFLANGKRKWDCFGVRIPRGRGKGVAVLEKYLRYSPYCL